MKKKNTKQEAVDQEIPLPPNGKWLDTNYKNQGCVYVDQNRVWGHLDGLLCSWPWTEWLELTAEIDVEFSLKGETARPKKVSKSYQGLRFVKQKERKDKQNGSNKRVSKWMESANL